MKNHFSRGYWKHEEMKSACLLILNVIHVGERYTKVKVEWYTYPTKSDLKLKENLKIPRHQYDSWEKI